MLKKMSVALLAASILAAPALAASPAKIAAANPAQTGSVQMPTGTVKSTAAKPHVRKVARHHRLKYRSVAHRHHNKVSRMHAAVKGHVAGKTRLGLNKASHIKKTSHKISFNKLKRIGTKLSFKRAAPAARRG